METKESCWEGYKLAAPAYNYSGAGLVWYGGNSTQEPPADVTYDHKGYNYVREPEPNGHVCIKETSTKKGHE